MSLKNHDAAQELYNLVLQTANYFLHNCKSTPIELLKLENPTYETVANLVQKAALIITALADEFDPMMGQKAAEYCSTMVQMGIAINSSDQKALDSLVEDLARRPGT